MDYFQAISYTWAIWGSLTYQVNVYSMFPWKTPLAETIFWVAQCYTVGALCFIYSFLVVFHGMYAYHKEICVRALASCIEKSRYSQYSVYPIEKIIQDYKTLHLATSMVGGKVCNILIIMYLAMGVQQTVESYVLFQMIKMGMGFKDVMFLLLDICLTLSRIAHSLYALSSVDLATQDFWRKIKGNIMMLGSGEILASKKRKERAKLRRTIRPIAMRLGPIRCTKSLLLTGMAQYTNYYIAAALWP